MFARYLSSDARSGIGLLLALFAFPSHAHSGFYHAPPDEIAGIPGSIIRTEAMRGAPLRARTVRILYRSTGLKGEPKEALWQYLGYHGPQTRRRRSSRSGNKARQSL